MIRIIVIYLVLITGATEKCQQRANNFRRQLPEKTMSNYEDLYFNAEDFNSNPTSPYLFSVIVQDMTRIRKRSAHGKIKCRGSVIKPQWIVTAASCIQYLKEAEKLAIKVPSADSNKSLVYTSLLKVIHPNFVPPFMNDIALIKLENRITGRQIQLQLATNEPVQNFIDRNYIFAVNNETTGASKAYNLKIVDLINCITHYNVTDSVNISNTNLCAKYVDRDIWKGVCRGDAGGPILSELDNDFLGGVTSTHKCTRKAIVFTLIFPYYDWIQSVLD